MWFLQPGITFYDLVLRILAILFIIFVVLPLHEFSHAWVACKLGDDTPRLQGRLTLNPVAHFSVWGAVCMLLFDFGWAKPVAIDTRNFKNPKRDSALVSLAGPVSNIVAALVGGLLLNLTQFMPSENIAMAFADLLSYYISINALLATFNLFPIPSFDGFKILEAFIPERFIEAYYKNIRVIIWVILILFLFGFFDYPLITIEKALYNFVIKITHIPLNF